MNLTPDDAVKWLEWIGQQPGYESAFLTGSLKITGTGADIDIVVMGDVHKMPPHYTEPGCIGIWKDCAPAQYDDPGKQMSVWELDAYGTKINLMVVDFAYWRRWALATKAACILWQGGLDLNKAGRATLFQQIKELKDR